MKKNLILVLFIFVIGFIYAVYPVKKSYAQSFNQATFLAGSLCAMIDDQRNLNDFFGQLPNYFPTSNVVQNAITHSWRYLGETQESGTGSMKEYMFHSSSVQEPNDANKRTSLMEERYLFISYPISLASHVVYEGEGFVQPCLFTENSASPPPSSLDTLQPTSENTQILGSISNGFYAKQTHINNNDPIRFTEMIRTTRVNFAGFDDNNKPLVKITVVPEIIQDNGAYIRYGNVIRSYVGKIRARDSAVYKSICIDEVYPLNGRYNGVGCYYQTPFYDKASDRTYIIRWSIPYKGCGNGGRQCYSVGALPINSTWSWNKTSDSDWSFSYYGYSMLGFHQSCYIDENGSNYCRYDGISYVPYYVPESGFTNAFNSLTFYDTGAIITIIAPKSEKIAIVNIPFCNYDSGGGLTHSFVDVNCWRKGLSLDGQVGDGMWHYYKKGRGILGNILGDILNLLTLGLTNNFDHLRGIDVLMPSFGELSTDTQRGLLYGIANPVIDSIEELKTYNLDFLGTVSDSIANPTKYFGVYSGNDNNFWTWRGRFSEPPTVTLNGPATVELPDKINLSWTSTNSDTCAASGDWSGEKATSSSESLVKKKGIYTFDITCSNVERVIAVSSVTTEVKRVPRCDFSAKPSSIVLPEFSTLKWDCSYADADVAKLYNSSADSCSIDNGIGNVSNVSGSEQVRPRETTTYRLTCTSDITKTYSATVSIDAPTGGAVKEVRP